MGGWRQGKSNASESPIKTPLKQVGYNIFPLVPQIYLRKSSNSIPIFDAGFDVDVSGSLMVPSGLGSHAGVMTLFSGICIYIYIYMIC